MIRATSAMMTIFGAAALALAACSGGGGGTDSDSDTKTTSDSSSSSSTGDSSSTSDSTSTGADTETTGMSTTGADTAADGEPCAANGECMSAACLKWTDAAAGECVPAPEGGNTRIAGTVVDFVTGATVGGAELRVVGALSALGDPAQATALVTATSMADGRVDVTTAEPLAAPIGIVATITSPDHYLAATGLASPVVGTTYGPMNSIRDIWALPEKTRLEWNALLMDDMELAGFLPIGDKGGVIGKVRDASTGEGIAGAKVVPEAGTTNALIRYLNDAGDGFVSDMTASSGVFVLVNPSLAETFYAEVDGAAITPTGKAGSASKNGVFMLILNQSQ